MNKAIIFCMLTGLFLVMSSCDSLKNKAGDEQVNTVPKPMEATIDIPVTALATNKDFVCGMKVEAGQIADTATYEGKIYGFCSKECKDEFVKDPNSYLSQK